MEPGSARTLLSGVVDYAGLFPPAGLSMAEAIEEYTAARLAPAAWMLGRFVLPAARLDECAAVRGTSRGGDGTWRLSAIVRDGSQPDREVVETFNRGDRSHGAVVDTIESKPASVDRIDWLAESFGAHCEVYVEVPAGAESVEWLERVKALGLRAKVRTGGLTPEAFPSPDALAEFLEAAIRLDVPFKATAGLHHAVRGAYRLTYEPESGQAPMYGYVNVLLAAAALASGHSLAAARALLTRDESAGLVFADDSVRWDDVVMPVEALARVRANHFVSFGSCSFREPSSEYRALASSLIPDP